jgi:hypothetical protein
MFTGFLLLREIEETMPMKKMRVIVKTLKPPEGHRLLDAPPVSLS